MSGKQGIASVFFGPHQEPSKDSTGFLSTTPSFYLLLNVDGVATFLQIFHCLYSIHGLSNNRFGLKIDFIPLFIR